MSHPVRYGTYRRKGTEDEFRFIGLGNHLVVGQMDILEHDVCLLAPAVSGFDLGAAKFKKSEDHTIYFTCRPDDFDKLFELVSTNRGTEVVP